MMHQVTETQFDKHRKEELRFYRGSCEKVWRACLPVSTCESPGWVTDFSPNEYDLGSGPVPRTKKASVTMCSIEAGRQCFWTLILRKHGGCMQTQDDQTRMMNLSHKECVWRLQYRNHAISSYIQLICVNVYYGHCPEYFTVLFS